MPMPATFGSHFDERHTPRRRADTAVRQQLGQQLQGLARRHGFYSGIYVHLGHGLGRRGAEPMRFAASSFMAERQFADHFPTSVVAQRAATAQQPFAWSGEAETVGIIGRTHAGIAIPVPDYAAGPAVVTLVGVDMQRAARTAEDEAPELMAAAAHIHQSALAELAPDFHARGALTAREVDVLRLAALGWSCERSGQALGIASRTVEFHLKNASEKLGAVNKVHAVAIAVSQGRISLA